MLALSRPPRWFSPPPSALAAARARHAARPPGDIEPGLPTCGWFDSSHDLRCGLAVTEHAGLEDGATVALAVGLWLQ